MWAKHFRPFWQEIDDRHPEKAYGKCCCLQWEEKALSGCQGASQYFKSATTQKSVDNHIQKTSYICLHKWQLRSIFYTDDLFLLQYAVVCFYHPLVDWNRFLQKKEEWYISQHQSRWRDWCCMCSVFWWVVVLLDDVQMHQKDLEGIVNWVSRCTNECHFFYEYDRVVAELTFTLYRPRLSGI